MKTSRLPCLFGVAVLSLACGGAPRARPQPAATVDDSCGLDCAAQKKYGLIAGTCFEYTTSVQGTSNPADLGVLVLPVSKLENDVRVLELEYSMSGQTVLTDSFLLTDGDLRLGRRAGTFGQFSYEDKSTGVVTGVAWLQADTQAGDSVTSEANVDVILNGDRRDEAVTYRVSAIEPDPAEHELDVPAKTYESGLKLIFNEQPSHGVDPQRLFVPDVGFVRFSSRLGVSGAFATFRLQNVRVPAPGEPECGYGSPAAP